MPSSQVRANALVYIAVCVLFYLYAWRYLKNRRRAALPPGPPADPLIGHLRLIPNMDYHLYFQQLGEAYGDITCLQVLGRPTMILNSVQSAVDLLEKRSTNYSDRPPLRIFTWMGWTHQLSMLQYGKQFRLHRRIFQQHFNKTKIIGYQHHLLAQARVLARDLLSRPEDKENICTRFSTAIITQIAYGHQVTSADDPYVKLAEEVGEAVALGGYASGLVDTFPVLQYLPSCFPGTHYIDHARRSAPKVKEFMDLPFREVQKKMAAGIARPSLVASHLEALNQGSDESGITIDDIKGAGTMAYFGGAETTSSALLVFTLAMVLYPEHQARAQAELDAVVGPHRLPDFKDRASLPYLECLLHETLRWYQPLPTGLPRRSMEDDIYNGMFIPKGSIVISNIRGMTRDENVYANASRFEPTRYLPKPEGRNEPRPTAMWGFGRRMCPGRHLADASLWIAMATILSTLRISKAVDEDGNELKPAETFITSITSRPLPFPCRVEARSQAAVALLSQVDTDD